MGSSSGWTSPYSSLEPTARKRGDILRPRIASSRCTCERMLVLRVSAGACQDTPTKLCAARCTTKSGLEISRSERTEDRSRRSDSRKVTLSRRWSTFSVLLRHLVEPKTWAPLARAYSAMWLPTNPVMPVIRTRIQDAPGEDSRIRIVAEIIRYGSTAASKTARHRAVEAGRLRRHARCREAMLHAAPPRLPHGRATSGLHHQVTHGPAEVPMVSGRDEEPGHPLLDHVHVSRKPHAVLDAEGGGERAKARALGTIAHDEQARGGPIGGDDGEGAQQGIEGLDRVEARHRAEHQRTRLELENLARGRPRHGRRGNAVGIDAVDDDVAAPGRREAEGGRLERLALRHVHDRLGDPREPALEHHVGAPPAHGIVRVVDTVKGVHGRDAPAASGEDRKSTRL